MQVELHALPGPAGEVKALAAYARDVSTPGSPHYRAYVTPAQFAAWVKSQQHAFAPVAKYLPKYATTYYPDPQRRAG